eukprot:Skav229151  [mRNA]  locus=scaffold2275:116280:129027:- [translate_table: standard]
MTTWNPVAHLTQQRQTPSSNLLRVAGESQPQPGRSIGRVPSHIPWSTTQALRQSGALKLQTAGTKAAEQALLALKALNQRYAKPGLEAGAWGAKALVTAVAYGCVVSFGAVVDGSHEPSTTVFYSTCDNKPSNGRGVLIAMSEANKEEIEKCKQIAQAALAGGDAEKASRFLQKAKRMCPTDTSIDELLAKAAAGASGSPTASPCLAPAAAAARPHGGVRAAAAQRREWCEQRANHQGVKGGAAGEPAGGEDGKQYTSEQMQLVQRILRTKDRCPRWPDYYDILEVPKNASEEAAKKAVLQTTGAMGNWMVLGPTIGRM